MPEPDRPPGSADGGLPVDSDVEVDLDAAGAARPVHLRPTFLLLAALGGAVGTAAREAVGLLLPPVAGFPFATLAVNLVGALILGALLEALVRRGPDRGRRRALRLLLGTGFCGGFTTYSAFAVDTVGLFGAGDPGAGILYAAATLLAGALSTVAGIALAAALHHRAAR